MMIEITRMKHRADAVLRLLFIVTLFSFCFSVEASDVTFKCKAIGENGMRDSVVYEWDSITGNFAKDFRIARVNTRGDKTHMAKWRLNKDQAIHIYAKDTVAAITQVELTCESPSNVDERITASAGEIVFVGVDVIRFVIPFDDSLRVLKIFKDYSENQLRVTQISINYIKKGEEYVTPKPLLPFFEPIEETYYRPWHVKLATYEPHSTIRYTTDGSTPTLESPLYSEPIYIDKDTKIKAITITDRSISNVDSAIYYIRELKLPLGADSTYLIDFSELERTAQGTHAIAEIALPENFDPDKKHPLFVWFSPGNGGYNTKRPRNIIQNTDFICVGLPYLSWHLGGGWYTPWDYHKTMLDSIEKLLPNIDPENRIVGGWSSGGAQIMRHIATSNGAFQDYFYAFLPGGAGFDLGQLETIKYRPMLITIGSEDKRSFILGDLAWKAELAGVDVTFNEMQGVGHTLPDTIYPYMHTWIYDKVITRNEPKSNAYLDYLNIAGKPLEGFDPKVTAYKLAVSKIEIPVATAEAQDSTSTVSIVDQTNFLGTRITVTATDGRSLTYTLYYQYNPLSSNTSLSDITINNVTIDGFSPDTKSYAVVLNTMNVPQIRAVSQDEKASIVVQQAAEIPGDATVTITAEDGTTKMVYTVSFTYVPLSSNAFLSDLTMDNVTIYGFEPDTTAYTVDLESDDIPVIDGVTQDEKASFIVKQANEIPGDATITVTAEDSTKLIYSVSFSYGPTRNDEIEAIPFRIYPNPARDNLTIAGTDLKEISIISIDGRILRTYKINKLKEVVIAISNLEKGIYQVLIKGDQDVFSLLLIKE